MKFHDACRNRLVLRHSRACSRNHLFWVDVQLSEEGLLRLKDNVAFCVPWLIGDCSDMKISEIAAAFDQKPSPPVDLYDRARLNHPIFPLPQDWFIGINSPPLQVVAKVEAPNAHQSLKPFGLQFSPAEYEILKV